MENKISYRVEGFSHGPKIRFEINNIEQGQSLDLEKLQEFIDYRSAKNKKYVTNRKEEDLVIIESGIDKMGVTLGGTISGYFINRDVRSSDYQKFKSWPRPSHVDYVAGLTSNKGNFQAGAGAFSGRLTVGWTALGGIGLQLLEARGIHIGGHILRLGKVEDTTFNPTHLTKDDFNAIDYNFPLIRKDKRGAFEKELESAIEDKNSLGGVIELGLIGKIKGLGGAYTERLESKIGKSLFSIPGVRAVEFGYGISSSMKTGAENNDRWILKDAKVQTLTNNSGGLNGGISNGMPIIIRAYIKPTPSISKPQESLNLDSGLMEKLSIEGRHDPAFIMRLTPVLMSMVALAILEDLYRPNLSLREQIDKIDGEICKLFNERFKITDEIGRVKGIEKLKIYDPKREGEILNRLSRYENAPYLASIYKTVLFESKNRQENICRNYRCQYGLIGRPLKHSLSPQIHKLLAGYNYGLFELEEGDFKTFLSKNRFRGLNVTIPYKQTIIDHLDGLSDQAKEIGAVNTVQFRAGKKYGFNTDYYGFIKLLNRNHIDVRNKAVLVLGTGASSKTVTYVLKKFQAKSIAYVSRQGDLNYENVVSKKESQIIINTSPVGMYPNNGQVKLNLDDFPKLEAVVDLVYNPFKTRLVLEAKIRGIKAVGGFEMLLYQAKKSIEIFNGKKIPNFLVEEVLNKLIKDRMNIVLIGMPGAGKTTIGKKLSKILKKKHVDLDRMFYYKYTIRPEQALISYGEEVFRDMEVEVAREVGSQQGLIISAGGGAVLRRENYFSLKQNGIMIQVDRDLSKLSTRNRPLSQGGINILEKMYRDRKPLYDFFRDYLVKNMENFDASTKEVLEIIKGELSKF